MHRTTRATPGDPSRQTLGEFITEWLRSQNWAVAELASATGIARSLIYGWLKTEPGQARTPSKKNLERLSRVMAIPVSTLTAKAERFARVDVDRVHPGDLAAFLPGAPELLTVADAARICSVSERTVRQWLSDEGFTTVKLGRRVLIPKASIVARLRSGPATVDHDANVARPDFILSSLLPELIEEVAATIAAGYSNIVFSGPPGMGKSAIAREAAAQLVNGNRVAITEVTFHPSYTYDDFVEGYRLDGTGRFFAKPGILRELAERAQFTPQVLVIDEINRAEASRVFGECLSYLDRRGEEFVLKSGNRMTLPQGLFILATNDTAPSIENYRIDASLLRRFWTIDLHLDTRVLSGYLRAKGADFDAIERAEQLYMAIDEMSRGRLIGPTLLFPVRTRDDLVNLWVHRLRPVLLQIGQGFDYPELDMAKLDSVVKS